MALRESRRSGARILGFVNAFAALDFGAERDPGAPSRDFEVTYGPGDYLIPHAGHAGQSESPGEVVFLDDDGTVPEGADPIVIEAVGPAREAHIAAAYVRRVVAAQADEGAGPAAGPARFKDVAILARRRSTLPFVELALSRLSVPYVVAGRALYDAPEVRDMAALLRLLLRPGDLLALATVLRGPLVGLSDTALALLATSVPGRGLAPSLLSVEPSAATPGDWRPRSRAASTGGARKT